MKRNGLYQIILKRRSVRLFKNKKILFNTIKKIIKVASFAPSAGNLQFLEYLAIDKNVLKEMIFVHTRWAGYIYPKRVPSLDKHPQLYIIILINKEKARKIDLRDVGAAGQNILLALRCFGLGGCWIASINKRAIRRILNIPSKYKIDSLIAAGFPAESPLLEERDDTVRYWLDKDNRFHVPKRSLKNIFHYNSLNK